MSPPTRPRRGKHRNHDGKARRSDAHGTVARTSQRADAVVVRAIRGAEIVRQLAALSEDVKSLAGDASEDEVFEEMLRCCAALAEGAGSAAVIAEMAAAEAIQLLDGIDDPTQSLPYRAALASSKSAKTIAATMFAPTVRRYRATLRSRR